MINVFVFSYGMNMLKVLTFTVVAEQDYSLPLCKLQE